MTKEEKGVISLSPRLEDISMGPGIRSPAPMLKLRDRQKPTQAPWLWVYTIPKLQAVEDTASKVGNNRENHGCQPLASDTNLYTYKSHTHN